MDITRHAWAHLVAVPQVVALVGSGGDWPGPWVWRWWPGVKIEGTGSRGIVISAPRPWAAPNHHNTAMFPMLVADCYADPSRDAGGHPLRADQEERALELAHAVREVLHVPQGGALEWDGLRVVSSVAGQDPATSRVDGSEVARASLWFELQVG